MEVTLSRAEKRKVADLRNQALRECNALTEFLCRRQSLRAYIDNKPAQKRAPRAPKLRPKKPSSKKAAPDKPALTDDMSIYEKAVAVQNHMDTLNALDEPDVSPDVSDEMVRFEDEDEELSEPDKPETETERPPFGVDDAKYVLATIQLIRKHVNNMETRLYSIENDALGLVQRIVAENEGAPGPRARRLEDIDFSRTAIEVFNNTSSARPAEGADVLKRVDLGVGRGPNRSTRGTVLFSYADI